MSKLGDKIGNFVLDLDLRIDKDGSRSTELLSFLEDLLLVIATLSILATPVLLPLALLKYLFS